MNIPPVFSLAAASSTVTALLGTNPVRFYIGEAEQGTAKPYAVWRVAYGAPENKLAGAPDEDTFGVSVDAYAETASAARAVAEALRNALEPQGYIMTWGGEGREPETRLFKFSFVIEFMEPR